MIELPKAYKNKPIFDHYCFYLDYFTKKYGEKTTVLMQVGTFYEVYGVDNENIKIGNAKEIASILNIEVTRKNKEIRHSDRKNYLMAGFPCPAITKFSEILMEMNYTVVIIDQVGSAINKPKGDKKLPRQVVEILSPGTFISNKNNISDRRFLVQIHIEGFKKRNNQGITNYQPLLIGLSSIDVTTGENDIYEMSNTVDDQDYAYNEISRYLQTHTPKELIISTNGVELSKEDLSSLLNLGSRNITYQFNYNQVNSNYYKLEYQKQYLQKVFQIKSMIGPLQYLNLEKTYAAPVSYLQLLDYIYQHNEKLLFNLTKPKIWNQGRLLLLANTAITQLDLHNRNTNRFGSICNMLNLTSTNMGRRLFKDRFLNPIRDPNLIEDRYDRIDMLLQDQLWIKVEEKLKGIIDLGTTHRRIELGLISPNGFSVLLASYHQVMELFDIIPDQMLPRPNFIAQFKEYIDHLDSILDSEMIYKFVQMDKINDNIFKWGYNKELDQITRDVRESSRVFEILAKRLSRVIGDQKGVNDNVLVKHTEASGYYFHITAIRYQTLFDKLNENPLQFQICGKDVLIKAQDLRILRKNKDKSVYNITCDLVDETSEQKVLNVIKLRKLVTELYCKFLGHLIHNYSSFYSELGHFVAEIDVYKANAKASQKYRYTRPRVIKGDPDQPSYLKAVNFRHPLVEQLNTNSYYVPHSIQLGGPPEDKLADSMLLYGCNSAGKSSFMKAVGVMMVMAQSGLFVPADMLEFVPYHRILTRILGNDDIHKGDSSFAVEIKELRDILVRADDKSLVLGDEICRGTETESGVAIVSAGICRLVKLKSQFIFATHLHQLVRDDEIIQLTKNTFRLGVFHLHVEYDPKNHRLIYDRTLREGSGNAMYGIEVARAMDLDDDFISEAHRFRHKYSNSIQTTTKNVSKKTLKLVPKKKDRYSKGVYQDPICQVCGAPSEATHHMKPQCDADSKGYIGSMHKNAAQNTVRLCNVCHYKIDTGELVTRGYQWTSEGKILDYVLVDS